MEEGDDTHTWGTMNGRAAEFEYQRDEELAWREDPGSASAANGVDNVFRLRLDYIIAVVETDSVYHIIKIIKVKASEQAAETSQWECRVFRATNLPPRFLDHILMREMPAHLTCPPGPGDEPNIHVLISTGSGTGMAGSNFANIVQPTLATLKIPERAYAVHHTRSAQTIKELTKSIFFPRAQDGIPQTLILLSGDGGVLDIVNTLLSPSANHFCTTYQAPTIAVVPCGTGNAIAHSYQLGCRTICYGTPRPLPVFHARFSSGATILTDEGRTTVPIPRAFEEERGGYGVIHGAVVLSYGLHASIVAESDTPVHRKHGSKRFQMVAHELLYPADGSLPHVYKAKLSVLKPSGNQDEEWIEISRQEHAYILNTLVPDLEEGFTISPLSRENRGKMYLIHFGPMSGDDVKQIMSLAYQGGKHVEEKCVDYEEVEGVRIEALPEEVEDRWRRVCVDGTIVQLEKGGWVEVRRGTAGTKGANERVTVQLVQP